MKRVLRLAARLYPPAWRARYGAEFEALLEDTGANWSALADVLKGAMVMQFTRWNAARMVALCGTLGLAVAGVIAIQTQDRYVSEAIIVGKQPVSGTELGESLRQAGEKVLAPSALADLIRKFDLYPEERKSEPLEKIAEKIRRNIDIVRAVGWKGDDNAAIPFVPFKLRFSYPDPSKAQAVTRELTLRFISAGAPMTSIQMQDAASLPSRPSFPNRPAMILTGLAIGLAAGFLGMGIRRWPIVAVAGIAGLLLGGSISSLVPPNWISTAVVHVTPPEGAGEVLNSVLEAGGSGELGASGSLYVRATGRKPGEAQVAAQRLVDRLVRQWSANPTAPSSVPKIVAVRILYPAAQPNLRFARLAIAFAGLLAGLVAGLLWRRYRPALVFRGV